MRTLCVALVAFSLVSVCRPAPLTCETLLAPVERGPDISGTWNLIAVASDSCLASVIMDHLNLSSFSIKITPTTKPDIYMTHMNFKLFGYCEEDKDGYQIFYNGTALADDENAANADMLSIGSADCLVLKEELSEGSNMMVLISLRKSLTPAELRAFDRLAECSDMEKPRALLSDDGRCKSLADEDALTQDVTDILTNFIDKLVHIASEFNSCALRRGCAKQTA